MSTGPIGVTTPCICYTHKISLSNAAPPSSLYLLPHLTPFLPRALTHLACQPLPLTRCLSMLSMRLTLRLHVCCLYLDLNLFTVTVTPVLINRISCFVFKNECIWREKHQCYKYYAQTWSLLSSVCVLRAHNDLGANP